MNVHLNTAYNWESAWLLFLGGATHERVCEMLGIPAGTLKDYASRHHWRERRTRAIKESNLAVTRDLANRIEKAKNAHQLFMLEQLDSTKSKIGAAKEAIRPDEGEITVERKLGLMDKQDVIARRVLGIDKDKTDPIQAGFAMLASISAAAADMVKLETMADDMKAVKVVEESFVNEDEKQPETDPSAIMPLLEDSDAFKGHSTLIKCPIKEEQYPQNELDGEELAEPFHPSGELEAPPGPEDQKPVAQQEERAELPEKIIFR